MAALPPPATVSPQLALDLRLRFLESLLTGSPAGSPSLGSSTRPRVAAPTVSLTRRADLVQAQLKEALETGGGGDAVRRFVQGCACLPRCVNAAAADDCAQMTSTHHSSGSRRRLHSASTR